MRRFLCLLLYVPLDVLAVWFDWLARKAYGPLYRENTRLEKIRLATRRSGEPHA